MLNIKTNLEEERLTVALVGRLDTTTAPELERCLQERREHRHDALGDLADDRAGRAQNLREVPLDALRDLLDDLHAALEELRELRVYGAEH